MPNYEFPSNEIYPIRMKGNNFCFWVDKKGHVKEKKSVECSFHFISLHKISLPSCPKYAKKIVSIGCTRSVYISFFVCLKTQTPHSRYDKMVPQTILTLALEALK